MAEFHKNNVEQRKSMQGYRLPDFIYIKQTVKTYGEYAENHPLLHFKEANCMECELYLH